MSMYIKWFNKLLTNGGFIVRIKGVSIMSLNMQEMERIFPHMKKLDWRMNKL